MTCELTSMILIVVIIIIRSSVCSTSRTILSVIVVTDTGSPYSLALVGRVNNTTDRLGFRV